MGKTIDVEHLLAGGQVIQLKAEGYSMYPLIVPGRDEVILSPLKNHKIKRGDVLLYRREQGILVLHRVCGVKRDGLYMVGDNQTEIEGPVPPEQVRGIMTGLVRKGRRLSTANVLYQGYSRLWLCLRRYRHGIAVAVHKIKARRNGD